MNESISKQGFTEQLVAGDDECAKVVFEEYSKRLLALVNQSLSRKLSRRTDPEDVIQSAFRSFFVRTKRGEFKFDTSDAIWNLLVTISLNKVRKLATHHLAQKRSVVQESNGDLMDWLQSREPTPTDAAVLLDELNQVVENTNADDRELLGQWLEGNTFKEMAEIRGCSERTIQRAIQKIRIELENRLLSPSKRNSAGIPEQRVREYSWDEVVLKDFLGSGGFGKVYRGEEIRTGKTVAVKTLKKHRQHDPLSIATFLQESRTLSRLNHPNIVRIDGVGQFPAGGFFLVMEFVDGTDLQRTLDRQDRTKQIVIEIIIVISQAILFAHEQGIIHGDIKPSNILVDKNGRLFVADFALTSLAVLKSGTTIGSVEYSAPELLEKGEVTPQCDLYSLGVLLRSMLKKDSASRKLEGIIQKATNMNPESRFESVNEFIIALKSLL